MDSLTAGLAAMCRMKFFGASRESVAEIYPTAEEARITVAIVHAARLGHKVEHSSASLRMPKVEDSAPPPPPS